LIVRSPPPFAARVRPTESGVTSQILLIRHAAHGHLGSILSGRLPGIPLSHEGRSQAERLGERLAGMQIDAVHASPVQRAQETAASIAAGRGLPVQVAPALEELDFGDWAGRSFVELAEDPRWDTWNSARESATAPGGESMAEAQARAWDHVARTARASPGRTVAMVTHCDIIRALVARVLGLSLGHIHRFDVDPASVTRLAVGQWGAKVLGLNESQS
jgi:probable phosphoglycerate mutase